MLAAHLDGNLERDFRVLCAKKEMTIKERLTRMVERELAEESENDEDPVLAGARS